MAEQMRPASKEQAPDPASSYGREKPEKEAGMGRLDNNKATPTGSPDAIHKTVGNKRNPENQVNAEEVVDQGAAHPLHKKEGLPPPEPVDHSMHDEEPEGWDQAPTDIKNPREKRHPKTEGKGGTP
ncbi:MAG TPA: hypothetical protein VG269_25330 [Tepidisphaeraceae bacterium]|jgi:hypothetical protein|nr:hypothetical protein [Tepidisphaeraceae bacterium]